MFFCCDTEPILAVSAASLCLACEELEDDMVRYVREEGREVYLALVEAAVCPPARCEIDTNVLDSGFMTERRSDVRAERSSGQSISENFQGCGMANHE